MLYLYPVGREVHTVACPHVNRVAVRCGVLRCVAVCCSVLQCVAGNSYSAIHRVKLLACHEHILNSVAYIYVCEKRSM